MPESDVYQRAYWRTSVEHYRAHDHAVVRAFTEPRIRTMARIIGPGKDKKLLDAGTGTGIFLVPFCEHWDAHGIDSSAEMLDSNPLRDRCTHADLNESGIADGAYDIVFTCNTLHHVEDPRAAVRELARISAEWLVFVEPNRYNPVTAMLGIVREEERGLLKFTPSYLRSLVPDDFRIVHTETSGMLVPNRIPAWMLPVLKLFDFSFPLGMFTLLIARRVDPSRPPGG